MYALGDCGIPQDAVQSRRWYTQAAEQGNVDAQYNLGTMWLDGEGGPIDTMRGLEWLRIAASREEPDAMSSYAAGILSHAYQQGLYGLEPDSELAAQWKQREQELEQRPFRSLPDWFYEETE